MKLTKAKEAEKQRILKLVQARCKHSRALAIPEEGHMLFKCLDCGKYFYKEVKKQCN